MIGGFLARLAMPWVGGPLIVALLALSAWCGVQQYRLVAERGAHAQTKLQHAQALAAAQKRANDWQARAYDVTQRAREELDERNRTIQEQHDQIVALQAGITRLSVDVGGLRNQLAAAGAARGASTSLAACVAWTGALEDALARGAGLVAEGQQLLVEGAGLAGQLAEAHDRRAAEVTALLKGWPHQQSTPGASQ